ncbi:short-chain dehydrogenase [Apiospora hydei]|uniref:Short-chain dehydrogenase n=1 Tax=Apiospora hydei TaxID=1337664 RepID=A0ABR1VAG3_9PEZI
MSSLRIEQLFSVKGHVAAVTGGCSGLGCARTPSPLAALTDARVFMVYGLSLPTDPIEETVAKLNAIGQPYSGSAIGIPCDVSDKDSIAQAATQISSRETQLDLLCSNAGIRRDPPVACDVLKAPLAELQASLWSARPGDWADTFAVNSTAHYFLSVALLPLLAAAAEMGQHEGRGAVVVTSSCASMHNATNIDLTSHAASKAATDHLVRLLAAKFSRFYVRVAGINPGFVPSSMNPVGEEGNIFSALFDKVPAKRPGNEADIAGAVLYLASRAGSYVNGVSLCIDGGRVLLANGQE